MAESHCKGCIYHHSAGRRNPSKELAKYNDWCCKRGGVVNVGWCKTHNAKTTADPRGVAPIRVRVKGGRKWLM